MCALRLVPSGGLHDPMSVKDSVDSISVIKRLAVSCFPPTHARTSSSSVISDLTKLSDLLDIVPCESGDLTDEQKDLVELKGKVLMLMALAFPGLDSPSPPIIEVIGIGSYNLVIGIAVPARQPSPGSNIRSFRKIPKIFCSATQAQDFALRVPLHGGEENIGLDGEVNYNVAVLQVIVSRLRVPVPKVLHYDLSENNPLGRPYVLQNKLSGLCLFDLWESLNAKQQASCIQEMTKTIEKIASVTARSAGFISTENIDFPSSSCIALTQFPDPNEQALTSLPYARSNERPALSQTPFEDLMERCQRWSDWEADLGRPDNRILWRQIQNVVQCLEARKWLGDRFHLVHDDLFPRNILAVAKNSRTVEITGIVDWDNCFFGPKFMAFRPPYWAWMEDYGHERDEQNATIKLQDSGTAKLRQAFKDAASAEYTRYALSEESVLARRLFYVVWEGMIIQRQRNDALDVIRRWNRLYPEDNVRRYE